MIITPFNALAGQRAALEAPAEARAETYRRQVMDPLRELWEPMLAYMPQASPDAQADPALSAARMFGFYGPDQDADEGLRAVEMLERAGSWPACRQALVEAADALRPDAHGIRLDQVLLTLVLMNPHLSTMHERSEYYTGFGGRPGVVGVLAWPTEFNVPRLPAVVAHEFHHNIRLTFEPWTAATSVGQYVVLEGLAEAFVAEMYGEDKVGPWATGLSGAELDAARAGIREALDVAGFDEIRGYIFGDWAAGEMGYTPRGLPDFAGYAVGYRMVRAYLGRSGRSAAEATYTPWREIVDGSLYL